MGEGVVRYARGAFTLVVGGRRVVTQRTQLKSVKRMFFIAATGFLVAEGEGGELERVFVRVSGRRLLPEVAAVVHCDAFTVTRSGDFYHPNDFYSYSAEKGLQLLRNGDYIINSNGREHRAVESDLDFGIINALPEFFFGMLRLHTLYHNGSHFTLLADDTTLPVHYLAETAIRGRRRVLRSVKPLTLLMGIEPHSAALVPVGEAGLDLTFTNRDGVQRVSLTGHNRWSRDKRTSQALRTICVTVEDRTLSSWGPVSVASLDPVEVTVGPATLRWDRDDDLQVEGDPEHRSIKLDPQF